MSAAPSPQTPPDLFCISCGYNQRGILADRCPECGISYATSPPSPTRLPWLHRRHLSLLRGYWRTAMMVIFRKQEFCEQIDTPITLRDARLFWLLSILQAWLPLLILALILAFNSKPDTAFLQEIRSAFFQSIFVPIPIAVFTLIGLLLFFTFATGMPSYFCHPRGLSIDRQNRAIALSYLASAPIAFVPGIVAGVGAAELLYRLPLFSNGLYLLAAMGTVLMLGSWYVRTAGIVLTLSQRRRRKLTVLILTAFWISLLFLCLFIIPLALWYGSAVVYSFF